MAHFFFVINFSNIMPLFAVISRYFSLNLFFYFIFNAKFNFSEVFLNISFNTVYPSKIFIVNLSHKNWTFHQITQLHSLPCRFNQRRWHFKIILFFFFVAYRFLSCKVHMHLSNFLFRFFFQRKRKKNF